MSHRMSLSDYKSLMDSDSAPGANQPEHRTGESISLSELQSLQSKGKSKKRSNKFNAQKTTVGDRTYDSKWEAQRAQELQIRERAGEIQDLQYQIPYKLSVNEVDIGNYIADFTYYEDGQFVVEDAKGLATPVFRLKKKLMRAIHGIEIYESQRAYPA